MRVLALGGGGDVGARAARHLVRIDPDLELLIADRSAEHARRAAASIGPEVRGIRVDVSDPDALHAAVGDADVVVNTVGPYFRYAVPILRAVIAAGRHYIDVCDDSEPTLKMLELDDAARCAGTVALIGMGASPGVSNLLAVTAAGTLDTVERIVTGWSLEDAPPEPGHDRKTSAATEHGIEQITGRIQVLREGTFVTEPPLRRVRFDYPGIGGSTGRSFGHPEAVTLPLAFPGAAESVNVTVGGTLTMGALLLLRQLVDRRVLTRAQAARLAERAERHLPGTSPAAQGPRNGLPPLFGWVAGTRNGRPARAAAALACWPGHNMGAVTAAPLAAAVGLLATMAPGVHTPETGVDVNRFFSALSPLCLGNPDPEQMVITTTSWEPDPGRRLDEAMRNAYRTLADSAGHTGNWA
jgi:saccharopine dehydrogenase-like NADP-dependent oxidoreductase